MFCEHFGVWLRLQNTEACITKTWPQKNVLEWGMKCSMIQTSKLVSCNFNGKFRWQQLSHLSVERACNSRTWLGTYNMLEKFWRTCKVKLNHCTIVLSRLWVGCLAFVLHLSILCLLSNIEIWKYVIHIHIWVCELVVVAQMYSSNAWTIVLQ